MEFTQEQKNIKKKAFLEALTETLGTISLACQKIHIGRTTIYSWIKDDKDFAKDIEEIQNEYVVDYVESKMLKKINEGESNMIMFFLNNKAKHRGYGQQRDREQQNNRVTTINIIHSDDEHESNTE